MMNIRAIKAIIRKDLKVVLQSKAVLIPLITVPLVLLIILPGIGGIMLANADANDEVIVDFRREAGAFFDNLPDTINERIERYDNEVQRIIYLVFNLFFPPLYLLLPTMMATVIAGDSFAGEKERKTLEALVYSPTTDQELYLAKLLGPWLVAITTSLIGYIAYAMIVTVTTFPIMNELFVFNTTWLLLIVWVTPAASGIGLGAMVLISSRVSTFQEAYQLGGLVVIPIIILLFGQLGGVIYFDPIVVILVGTLLWAVAISLIWYGARTFQRGKLVSRL